MNRNFMRMEKINDHCSGIMRIHAVETILQKYRENSSL
jgi:hypothetical protein